MTFKLPLPLYLQTPFQNTSHQSISGRDGSAATIIDSDIMVSKFRYMYRIVPYRQTEYRNIEIFD